jgi:hypothetical protein
MANINDSNILNYTADWKETITAVFWTVTDADNINDDETNVFDVNNKKRIIT